MGERRMGDRRAPEKGVIKVPFKDAVIYFTFSLILIVSISANIILASLYNKYRTNYEYLVREDYEEVQSESEVE